METEIQIKKNCDNCIKKSACKFLHTYKETVKSNLFYEMFEYLEWNNLEEIFKDNAQKCKHYHQSFPNGKLELAKVGYDVFSLGIRRLVGDNHKSTTVSNNIEKLKIDTRNGETIDPKIIEDTFTVKIVNKIEDGKL